MTARTAIIISVILLQFGTGPTASAFSSSRSLRKSVVKIYVTIQRGDYMMPWQGGRPMGATGTGFVISNRRILTNAHVVSDARFVQVQKDGDPRRFMATVDFRGHDCDLATLKVDDPTFFEDTKALKFADAMPTLDDEVLVLGFPIGGTRLSITKGIVSRVDYSVYSHSGVDQHLVLQVDAAINPGNSGGPIFFKGKVAALAFQGLSWGDNIGYGIPLPVLQHFLDDIKDGTYHGYPELGVAYLDIRNKALRQDLKMQDDKTGAVVYYVDPFGSAHGIIEPGDVLLSIDGKNIEDDGTINLNGESVIFSELLERKQSGESIKCLVWRNAAALALDIPLIVPDDPFLYRNVYDMQPEYFITGGLVFSPLSGEYLKSIRREAAKPNVHQLLYYAEYAKNENLYEGHDEFVVLAQRLPHPVNTYADEFMNGLVESVNGLPVAKLEDLKTAFKNPGNGFHVIRFIGMDDSLVLDAKAVVDANPLIIGGYNISAEEYIHKVK